MTRRDALQITACRIVCVCVSIFLVQAFSKKCVERRKEWLTQWLQQRRDRCDQDESLLYSERMDHISYSDFVNKELILFSNMDNERSIGSSVDGEELIFICIHCVNFSTHFF